jgi:hypothetical protein
MSVFVKRLRPFILHVRPIDMSMSCTMSRKLEVFIRALIPFASCRKNFTSFVSSQVSCLVSDMLSILMHVPSEYTPNSTLTTSARDCICSHKHTLLTQDIITSKGFYCITQRQPNNILIYFYVIIFWNFNFNRFNI